MSEMLSKPLSPKFTEAVGYALDAHRTQSRKGTEIPYAAHILAVASLVLEMEADEDEAIAALLHDVIEDAGAHHAEEIERRFGPDVLAIVRANSDTDQQPKPPWLERKRAYIAGIATKSPAAVRVSIADKLHNARSNVDDQQRYGDEIFERFRSDAGGEFASKRDGVVWYYEALVEAFEARRADIGPGAAAKLDDLARAVGELRAGAVRFPPPGATDSV
ncbi:MAG: HD domain-containing protein [Solirubrobacterales bacterium]